MQLEADAREALPYVSYPLGCAEYVFQCTCIPNTSAQSIENCTKDLGPLRQSVFSCLTCNPPPANASDPYNGAGICYACSVQCHGEHQLVEIFTKRNFTCDCGTTRLPATSPCTLRLNAATNARGVRSEEPSANNKYNQNFRNRFCACECDYDPFQQKGTMFQCLGLGTHDNGGCGEDWYHPGCVMGLGPDWYDKAQGKKVQNPTAVEDGTLPAISENAETEAPNSESAPLPETEAEEGDDEQPNPPGFPKDEEFETFICFKCVEAHSWIKRYAGTPGFLSPIHYKPGSEIAEQSSGDKVTEDATSKKRKAEDREPEESQETKRLKNDTEATIMTPADKALEPSAQDEAILVKEDDTTEQPSPDVCKYDTLPPTPEGIFSLFCTESFRDRFCRCKKCYPHLATHAQLLEEEEIYEPPVSEEGSENGGSTHGSGSLYERGESALRNVDRVRAIEGVMAYNQLKDKLKPFFQQFAESGQAISAEDIKEYFAKLRGDDEAIKEAGEGAKEDQRKEQPGY